MKKNSSLKSALVGILAFTTLYTAAYADVAANTLPVYNPNNSSNVSVSYGNKSMNIDITGGKNSVGSANYDSFNIGKNATFNVNFTAQNQTSLNKVNAAGGIS